jgi:hypothetical protein
VNKRDCLPGKGRLCCRFAARGPLSDRQRGEAYSPVAPVAATAAS